MAPNNHNYYDSLGSEQNHLSGYRYQQRPASSNAGFANSNATTHSSQDSQSYAVSSISRYGGAQRSRTSANHAAAAALSSLSSPEDTQMRSKRMDGGGYGPASGTSGNKNRAQIPRTQAETSQGYGGQQTSGPFGRLSVVNGPSDAPPAPAFAKGSQEQHNSWHLQQRRWQSPPAAPQRYASPLHAMQAQQQQQEQQRGHQSHNLTAQRRPHLSEQQTYQGRQSGSVEHPQQTTVDPSQVYDIRAEQQRKAQIELEKKRKWEEAAAARKAEEDRTAEGKRKLEEAARKLEQEKVATGEAKRLAEAKAAEKETKAADSRRAREEKKQSTTAAATLATMASTSKDTPVDEEAEMRAMFAKMRQFNAKNPQMLAKLWEEERVAHASGSMSRNPQTPGANAASAASVTRRPNMAPPHGPQPSRPAQPLARPTTQNQTAQQKPAPVSPNTPATLWPPHKKDGLSYVAANWLSKLPSNAGKNISTNDVFKILDSNPKYVQLCEALEARGLVFERAQLARELLKGVPELDKPRDGIQLHQGSTGGAVAYRINLPEGKAKTTATVSYDAPSFLPLSTQYVQNGSRVPVQLPGAYVPHGGPVMHPAASIPPSQSPVKDELRAESVRRDQRPRPPANKEEAARKRTFTDLVDLTAGDSDDETPPNKMMKFSRPPPGAPTANGQHPGMRPPGPPPTSGHGPPIPGPSNYMRGPDLSTHSHPPVQPVGKGPSFEFYQQQSRIKGKMLVEPIMRDRVARKSVYDPTTIARDVLLATGRHPDMRGLNMHLAPLEKLLGSHGGSYDTADGSKGNRSDLSTIRWDLIDPEPPAPQRPVMAGANSTAVASRTDNPALIPPKLHDIDADDEFEDEPPIISRQAADNGDGTMSMAAVYGSRGPIKGLKRRGRPPGSRKLQTMASSNQPSNLTSAASTGTPQPRERPSGTVSTTAPIGYAAFRNVDENGVKKKGRPVGWRKAIHSREALGLAPAKPGASASASRMHPSKDKDEDLKKPKYQVYKCKWLECPAELHNLDTLKKHIVKVHGTPSSSGKFACLWQSCEGTNGKGKGKAGSSDGVLSFDGLGSWIGHIDQTHLQPVAWQMGDGPRGGQSDFHETTDSEAYLSDARGRSVTPVIRPDVLPSRSRVAPDRPMARDERKAVEDLQKLEERKNKVGFTMEKSGSTFAIPKRRKGFMDDEDFEDVIHEKAPDPGW